VFDHELIHGEKKLNMKLALPEFGSHSGWVNPG
jgi:hypothetical protein